MSGFDQLCLKGKVAVVTGSSAGIGAATAILMAQRGAKITLHGRREDKLREIAEKIESVSGEKPYQVLGNVEDTSVRDDLINGTIKNFGRLDILVNNAGWMKIGNLETTSVDEFRTMQEIHVVAPFELSKMAAPELIKNKGNIIMISSVCGLKGFPMVMAYSSAKAGMDNLMRGLAGELAPKGVRVNSVNPGPVLTDLLRDFPDFKKMLNDPKAPPATPLGKAASSEEVAELIAFLASNAASMISGNTHTIDGATMAAEKPQLN